MSIGLPESSDVPWLVGDIGGTNARFALANRQGIIASSYTELACSDYANLVAAVEVFLCDRTVAGAVLAVATPTQKSRISFTNNHWDFDVHDVVAELRLPQLIVINDFTALALSVPHLPEHCLQTLVSGVAHPESPRLVIGPGTGLGCSALIPSHSGQWLAVTGEGGHATYRPRNARELALLERLQERYGAHVSVERVASGPGLAAVYQALAQLDGDEVRVLHPAQIVAEAQTPRASEALEIFCAALGGLCGDLALAFGARGGIYLGGGVVPKIVQHLLRSEFLSQVQLRGRFQNYCEEIPIHMICAPSAAMYGCIAARDNVPMGAQNVCFTG